MKSFHLAGLAPSENRDNKSPEQPTPAACPSRRNVVGGMLLLGATGMAGSALAQETAQTKVIGQLPLGKAAPLGDPVGGNPKGNTTIVTFFDYNCPFCKRTVAPMNKVVAADGQIRVIYKEWPILATSSVFGAKLALVAAYQGKYLEAHHALMGLGRRPSEDDMVKAVTATGIDMKRMEADTQAHGEAIMGLLRRNNREAEELGLQGTPAFIVGSFLIPAALDEDGFRQVVSDARKAGATSD